MAEYDLLYGSRNATGGCVVDAEGQRRNHAKPRPEIQACTLGPLRSRSHAIYSLAI